MDRLLELKYLKSSDFIVYEEDFVDALINNFNISLKDSIFILEGVINPNKEYIKQLNVIFKNDPDSKEIIKLLLSFSNKSFVNRKIDGIMESSVMSIIDSYTNDTGGKIEYIIQAQCLIFALARFLPTYFKTLKYENIEDEDKIKENIQYSCNMLEEDYPRIKDRLEFAFSTENWNTSRVKYSYLNREEIIMEKFIKSQDF